MAKSNLDIIISLVDNASGGLAKIGKNADALANKMKSLGRSMTLGLTLPLAGIAAASIKAASDLQESMNKVDVVFGDASDSVKDFAKSAAKNLGMSNQEALEAAGTFGNLFTSMGIGANVASEMSTSLLTLSADLASFNNIDPTVALEKLRAGLVGEVEPLRVLGVNLTAATIKAKALEMGLIRSGQELTAAAKTQAAYALILEQTGNAQGDFARTSDGLANSTRIMQAQLKDAAAMLGQNLLPVALQVVQGLNTLLEAFNNMPPGAQKTIVAIGAILAAIGPLLTIIGNAITIFGSLKTALAGAAGIKGVAVAAVAAKGGLTALIGTAAAAAAPFLMLAAAVVMLIVVIKTFGAQAATAFKQLLFIIGHYLMQAINKIKEFVGPMVQAGIDFVTGLREGFNRAFSTFVVEAVKKVNELVAKIKSMLKIGSPSKVGTDIGSNLALSIGSGFKHGMDKVAKMIPKVMGGATLSMAGGISGVSSISGRGGGATVNLVYSPTFSAASYKEFETRLVPMIDRQLNHNERRRAGRGR